MRISSLFKRQRAAQASTEPQAAERIDPAGSNPPLLSRIQPSMSARDEHIDEDGYVAGENLRGSNAVFGLIGTHTSVDDTASNRIHDGEPSTDDIIGALYRQYCRVLDDPQASLVGDRFTQSASANDDDGEPISPADDYWKSRADGESIETFLTGAQKMEHAFELFGHADALELTSMEPAPDILRLFAPAEYAAAVRRRPPVLPPALARREHHSLGIDSPLFAPRAIPLEKEGA